jgi:hypothetical protein
VYFNPQQIVFENLDESDAIYFVSKGELEIYISENIGSNSGLIAASSKHNKGNQNIKVLCTLK